MNQLVSEIVNSGFQQLPIAAKHAAMVMQLPDVRRDPFDRILIAQALCEPLRFLSANGTSVRYSELVDAM